MLRESCTWMNCVLVKLYIYLSFLICFFCSLVTFFCIFSMLSFFLTNKDEYIFDECRLSVGWPPTLRPSQSTWAESADNWQLSSTSTVAVVIITQPVSWYSLYRPTEGRRLSRLCSERQCMVKVDRRIRWHYTTTILRLRIGARLTRYRHCKFHYFARTISRHAGGISRYSVPPSSRPTFTPAERPRVSARGPKTERLRAELTLLGRCRVLDAPDTSQSGLLADRM